MSVASGEYLPRRFVASVKSPLATSTSVNNCYILLIVDPVTKWKFYKSINLWKHLKLLNRDANDSSWNAEASILENRVYFCRLRVFAINEYIWGGSVRKGPVLFTGFRYISVWELCHMGNWKGHSFYGRFPPCIVTLTFSNYGGLIYITRSHDTRSYTDSRTTKKTPSASTWINQ